MSFNDEIDEVLRECPEPGPLQIDLDYVREKLLLAVLCMSADTRSLRERVDAAYLHYHVLRVEDFPADLRQDFSNLVHAVPKGGTFMSALARLSDGHVRALIHRLVWLNDAIAQRVHRTSHA